MKQFIYADNAATTKLDVDAFEAMKPWLLDEYGNASQPYSFSRRPKEALKKACLGASLSTEFAGAAGGTITEEMLQHAR